MAKPFNVGIRRLQLILSVGGRCGSNTAIVNWLCADCPLVYKCPTITDDDYEKLAKKLVNAANIELFNLLEKELLTEDDENP